MQDYLDAQIALAQRRGQSDDADHELRERAQAKQHLLDEVSRPYPRAAEPLMIAIREFLHAETALDRCPPGGAKWGHAAAQLEMARHALVERIRCASGDAFVTCHQPLSFH